MSSKQKYRPCGRSQKVEQSPSLTHPAKYITEQDITDALCKGGGFEDSKFRIQQYLSAQVLPIEEDQARWLKKNTASGGTWIFRDGGHGFLDHMGKILKSPDVQRTVSIAAF